MDPTAAASLEPQANPESASEPTVGDLLSGEGAASGALGEASSEESPKFDALSLLDPVKQEDQEEVTAEQIFEELADPAEPSSSVVEAHLEDEESNNHPETANPEEFDSHPPQEGEEVSNTAEFDPIVGSSSTIDPKEEEHPSAPEASAVPASTADSAPVYVQFFGGEEEEDSVPPPPTSPFLEAAGAAEGASSSGHVQTGHSPAALSRPPRIRGTKGGRKEQTKRLIKRWQQDFDILARFLWDEAEFWLHYVQHEDAHPELIWTVRVIRVLLNHCTTNQILVHFANVFAPYRNWTFYNGYRRKDGLRRAPETTANTVLPGRDHINLQAFGQADPPRSDWDDYNTYRGPQAKAKGKAKAKASVFTQNTDPPTPEEDNSNLGVDPAVIGTLFLRGNFFLLPGEFFSRLSSRRLVCQGSKAASKPAS